MKQGFLEARKKRMIQTIYYPSNNKNNRGFHKGDLRCIKCLKWINPNDPIESELITLDKDGGRMHKDCPVNAYGAAYLRSRPRNRHKGNLFVQQVKRY